MANSAFMIQALTDQSIPFWNTANTFSVNMSAPSGLAGNISFILPGTQPTATGQILYTTAAGISNWTTATYPLTTTANQLLYSTGANTVAGLATANNSVLITSAGGVPSMSTTLPTAVLGNITSVGALDSGSLVAGFTPVTVPIGGTGNTTFTAYSIICAGTTATGTFQNVVGLGTNGYVLTSNGAGALPTWQSTGAVTGVASVSGTALEIDVTPTTGNVVVSIDAGYVGQASITTVGIIGTGTWNAGHVTTAQVVAGNLTISGTTITSTGLITLAPTGGNGVAVDNSLALLAGGYTAYYNTANTFYNSFNTQAGQAVSVNYLLPLAAPGTNGFVLSSTTAGVMSWIAPTTGSVTSVTGTSPIASTGGTTPVISLNGTATVGQVLQSASATTTAYSTATYPLTTTINQLLYSSAANTIVGLATATTAVLTTSAGVPTWASELSLALGGTNANLTASNGGIFYSTATAGAILAGTATAGQLLTSGASTTPAWTTSTYPATNAISTLLYASSANVMAALPTANSGVLVTSAGGVPSISTTLPSGLSGYGSLRSFQIFTSGTAATYTKPAGILNILVECLGGGAGGGGAASTTVQSANGGGGGSGGYARKFFSGAAATYTYTVGALAAGGTAGNNAGTAGNATTFSTISANGGGAGGGGVASSSIGFFGPSGGGGSASGGDINVPGNVGGLGFYVSTTAGLSGFGAGSHYGGSVAPSSTSAASAAGNSGSANTGAGGGGGSSSGTSASAAGGAGGSGLIIVWEFA